MASNKFVDNRKRLEDRKSKITSIVKGIKEHEQDLEKAAQNRPPLRESKFAEPTSSHSSWENPTSKKSSVVFSENSETRSGKKRSSGKGKTKIKGAPGGSTEIATTKNAGTKSTAKKKLSVAGSVPGKRRTSFRGSKVADSISPVKKSIRRNEDIILSVLEDEELNNEDGDEEENDFVDEEEGFLHIVEALHCFENTKYIFMQRLLDYIDKTYLSVQIINFEGELLFLMKQSKVKCTGFIVYSTKSFENILYDIYGNKVLKFIGPSVFLSKMTSKMLVTDSQNRMLGYIKAFGTKVNYSVYNAIGERLFLVVSDLCLPSSNSSFTILCRGRKIGVIKTGWKQSFQDLSHINNETSGIEFPPDMDSREKALLLGCLMLIEFFWYSPLTRLKLSLLFLGIFLFLLVVIVLCIPFLVDSPDNDDTTKSFYIAERLEKPKKSGESGAELGIG